MKRCVFGIRIRIVRVRTTVIIIVPCVNDISK
jgi:hypothetical protein